MSQNSELLTVPEFADALRVKPSCIRRWIQEKKVTIIKLGRVVRIPAEEVARLVHNGRRPAK